MQGEGVTETPIVAEPAAEDTYESVEQLIFEEFKAQRHENSVYTAQKYIDLFKHFTGEQKSNRALGCIFGSLIGDALGAFCEFQDRIEPEVLESAMLMPGGGTFNLREGQYTDDNELAYHLLSGLARFDPERGFETQKQQILNNVGSQFVTWWNSDPFDIGITCSNGLKLLEKYHQSKDTSPQEWENIYAKIMSLNHDKESNGSLMRIAPMALFLTSLNLNPIYQKDFIEAEIKMTHPNLTLKQAGTSWVTTLCSTILRKDDKPETFTEIYQSIKREDRTYELLHQQDWFGEAEGERRECMPANRKIGWAKIAWTFGMRLLREQGEVKQLPVYDGQFYKREIEWVIGQAGDTDTNAAIVGGLIGAMIGFKKLPVSYLRKIFKLKFPLSSKIYTDRPIEYEPVNFLKKALNLLQSTRIYNSKAQN